MNAALPDVGFEYDCGDTTVLTEQHRVTGRRTIPATVCVCPVNSVTRIEIDGQKAYYLTSPDSFVVPRDVPHCLTLIEGENPVSIWCHFRISIFHGLDLLRFYDLPRRFTGDTAVAIRDRVLALNAAHRAEVSPDRLFRRQSEGFELVKTILSASCLKTDAAQMLSSFSRIGPALRFMRERIGRSITLDEIAATVNLSKSRFSGLFQEITGVAPVAYFNQLRIKQAQELLLLTSLSIGEVAEQLGFYDAYHFSRKFKRMVGSGPKEYRTRTLRSLYSEQ